MSFDPANLVTTAPEVFLLGMVCFILVFDLFLDDARRHWSYTLTLLALIGTAVIAVSGAPGTRRAFGAMFVDDPMARALKAFVCISVAAMLVYGRAYCRERALFRGELFVLSLTATLGMLLMISASHFLTLYLGLELMSLSLYSMVALSRDSVTATEAATKYFVLGALASGMLLYGLSMIYGATGGHGAPPTLQIAEVASRIASSEANQTLLVFGLVFVVAGLAFKLGTVPFHMWVPDVYQGAPTAVTLLIASASELAAFAFVLRILVQALGAQPLLVEWQQMLILLAVLSMAVGNVTAIAQSNIKRMLAYSTISHMGFMLLGIVSGSLNGYAAAMFYMVTYVLTVAGAFAIIMLLSRRGFEADLLDDFKGLNQRDPWYAFLMLLIMFSLAGVPPVVGFYAKLSVFQAVMDAGMTWLAVVGVLFSLVGAFYYLRVVKLMYFDDPQEHTPLSATGDVRALLSLNGLAVLALGVLPGGLMDLCQRAIQGSF
jgi:NADH-quinone oxidoreductase subunit N